MSSLDFKSQSAQSPLKNFDRLGAPPFTQPSPQEPKRHLGKTQKQILKKNPLFSGIKKFIMKNDQIKSVAQINNELGQIIETIPTISPLCQPTKAKLRAQL